ncbi:hypothetical protein COW36_22245 [bacterium (Candidatus Blackallbacteria) CG17_big_fil_post_rev_8_21_14_2_50_48_46]|uniref:Histone-lysine N-methyltransferase, H3 lysine-79 specific n=1 Tax=bacterium (Candidatus Blackallbacteria) CG17_big_fil_post_rev_8_21_14_2_50_48_46 TaxID=2014261 RepID=A0A2M7FYP6_9BACT|nr:MAG: hypothetical protein COW64_13675 [bacterium (Candidatus Blackallbacteria) CG18_big_fil_WC_8_21_14_2_50_49_26]PIW14336.1 MAG: hypothetical protein COW36_22245 [bacterium (Candidatus Blackallbacteria) CG17_big_fil_post_rev_8_21_14_2_50_48_46]PIW45605.1 MAG: hypothetical protein COW20_19850 [bacterium (Candidatus Blackallbacteria) CG13_big_fil_rev_8_21_14_2_50_49_14]
MRRSLFALLELPWLLVLNFWNHFYTFGLWLEEAYRFYRLYPLFLADLYWMLEYAWSSPFSLSRKATQKEGLPEDLTVYGETPWTTLEAICQEIELKPEDVFVELGCGTGRNLLFVSLYFYCRSLGYELVPRFIEKLRWLLHKLKLEATIQIFCQNWFEADLSSGTVFFLVGTCYSDENLERASQKLRELPAGVRVITVSWALPEADFETLKSQQMRFSWGKGTVFFQRRR